MSTSSTASPSSISGKQMKSSPTRSPSRKSTAPASATATATATLQKSPNSKSEERPYSLYATSSSYSRHSLRQKSFNLHKMSHSISQNLIDIQFKNKQRSRRAKQSGSGSGSRSRSGSQTENGSSKDRSINDDDDNPMPMHTSIPMPTPTPRNKPLPTLPQSKTQPLIQALNTFLTHHLSFHRPIALITSGGTITTLEQNTIRYLDNFSTGQRGAISVEEFCKRGYAVIHLCRVGSTTPYSRVLSKLLGCKQGNHGLNYDALGLLFEGQQGRQQEHQQQQQQEQLEQEQQQDKAQDKAQGSQSNADPWLSSTKRSNRNYQNSTSNNNNPYSSTTATRQSTTRSSSTNDPKYSTQNRMNLTTHILHSNLLQRKLRERSNTISNNLLYTIPFTTIEEYIALLKIATEAMDQCQSLGLIYLCAAVSDFYIPDDEKCVHKIQSRDYGLETKERSKDGEARTGAGAIVMNESDNTLSLTMQPVPKVIHHIRQQWSPHSYCVSFKLETDENILRQKVNQAIKKYNLHLVIGNVLATRHDKVSLFEFKQDYEKDDNVNDNDNDDGMKVTQVSKLNPMGDIDGGDDILEDNIISHVVEKHFEYISNHYLINADDNKNNDIRDIDDDDDDNDDDDDDTDLDSLVGAGESKYVLPRTALMTGAEAAARHNAYMRKKKETLQKELHWKRLRDVSVNIASHALGCYLTFVLSSAVQNYMH